MIHQKLTEFTIPGIKNKTKWPRQVRELIRDSDSEILDFWTFDEKNNGEIFCIFCMFCIFCIFCIFCTFCVLAYFAFYAFSIYYAYSAKSA